MSTSDFDNLDIGGLVTNSPALVEKTHTAAYPAISPLRPELNQSGKTILITGASAGIGFAVARAFAEASATRIILTGRRKDVLEKAASKLSSEFKNTEFVTRVVDVGNLSETKALWSGFRDDGIFVDVLVLNAAKFGAPEPLLKSGLEGLWNQYEMNVRTLLDFTERLYKQEGYEEKQKYIVNVSSAVIHVKTIAAAMPAYSITKASGQFLLQRIAQGVNPKKMQMVNFHPGMIFSETSKNSGLDENSLPWDNENLPAQFAVWAATPEAAFLHGRFAYAAWDVEQMQNGDVKKRVEADPDFLTIGLMGL